MNEYSNKLNSLDIKEYSHALDKFIEFFKTCLTFYCNSHSNFDLLFCLFVSRLFFDKSQKS